MITRPQLPPKAGYVERIDAEGNHYYAPTAETLEKLAEQERRNSDTEVLNVLLGVTE